MARDNLSDLEISWVDKMNEIANEDDRNIFVQASIKSIIQHLIECTCEQDVIGALNDVIFKAEE